MDERVILPEKWQEWEITEYIGEGSYGKVYQVCRGGDPSGDIAALKIIELPRDKNEADSISIDYPTKEGQTDYYRNKVESVLSEIKTMEELNDSPASVKIFDYCVVHVAGEMKWTIFILMEYLTPFQEYRITNEMDEDDVIRLGMDICDILQSCTKHGIIHRDIKPGNILADEHGHFKLGDFGIARKLEAGTGGLTLIGTYSYMAPEVYHGEHYDERVDQYSLGLVLYYLMNNNRPPFTDPDQQMISSAERDKANQKRLEGEAIPDPAKASASFGKVIRKACAYRPDDRFRDPAELKRALEKCLSGDTLSLSGLFGISESERVKLENKKRRRKRLVISLLIAGAAAAALLTAIFMQLRKTEDEIFIEESRKTEAAIEKTGIQADNALSEYDISKITAVSDDMNLSGGEGESVLELIDEFEAWAMDKNAEDRQSFDSCERALAYIDEEKAAGVSVNYKVLLDNTTNTQKVRSLYTLYYFVKDQEGIWQRAANQDMPEEVLRGIYGALLPEEFTDSYEKGLNCGCNLDALWAGSGSVYDSAIVLRTGAFWQNEDGSVDVYMICRNGTDMAGEEYNYWLSLTDSEIGEIIKGWGKLEPGLVLAPPQGISGYIAHFDAEDVISGEAQWTEGGISNYTSGYNSNYK